MNKEEKEKIRNQIIIEESKTSEGRLKIEKIEKYKNDSDEYRVNAIFYGIMTGVETLIRIIYCNAMNKEGILRLIPINLIPLVVFIYKKKKADKKIYNLEEEVLNLKTK